MEDLVILLNPFQFRGVVLFIVVGFVALIFIGFVVVEIKQNNYDPDK